MYRNKSVVEGGRKAPYKYKVEKKRAKKHFAIANLWNGIKMSIIRLLLLIWHENGSS